jgi:hypothetical protein
LFLIEYPIGAHHHFRRFHPFFTSSITTRAELSTASSPARTKAFSSAATAAEPRRGRYTVRALLEEGHLVHQRLQQSESVVLCCGEIETTAVFLLIPVDIGNDRPKAVGIMKRLNNILNYIN